MTSEEKEVTSDPSEIRFAVTFVNFTGQAGDK